MGQTVLVLIMLSVHIFESVIVIVINWQLYMLPCKQLTEVFTSTLMRAGV
jgi:hypothetical protein